MHGDCKPSPSSLAPQSPVLQPAGTPRHLSSARERRHRTSAHEVRGSLRCSGCTGWGVLPPRQRGPGSAAPKGKENTRQGGARSPSAPGTAAGASSALQGAGMRQGVQGSCRWSPQYFPLAGKGGMMAFLGSRATGQKRLPGAQPRLYSRGCPWTDLSEMPLSPGFLPVNWRE